MMEIIEQQPVWLQLWLNVLSFGVFVVPLALLIWRPSRAAGVVTLVGALLGGVGVFWMFGQMGYVKLLGLPHVIIWTPLAIYLWGQARRADMPRVPGVLIWFILTVIVISLAFDYIDVIRYILGERTPVALGAPA